MTRQRTLTLRLTWWEWILILIAAAPPLAAGVGWLAIMCGCIAGIAIGVWRLVDILGYQLENQQAYREQDHPDDDSEEPVVPPEQRHAADTPTWAADR